MNSGFFDPNNHVPELAQGDDWCDRDPEPVDNAAPPTFLPPRRSARDPDTPVSEKTDPGLRIDGRARHDNPPAPAKRLEVQEIGSQVVRLVQEAPVPPKVERVVAFHERPVRLKGSTNTRGEGKEWGRVHRGSPRWILAMGGTVLLLVILGIVMLPKINAPNVARVNPALATQVIEGDETPEGVNALNRLLPRQAEAAEIYRSFAHASHPDEIVPLIRDGANLDTALRERWQPLGITEPWAPAGDAGWSVIELEGHPCAMLSGHLPDNSRFHAYFTADHGQLLLDWKATTAYGTATFDELASARGDGSEIRGEISMTEFYTRAFPEKDYQSFRLVSPDGLTVIWCYASRQSTALAEIASQLQPGEIVQEAPDSKKIALRLVRGSGDALPNQWLIDELLHFEWVSP